MHSAISFVFFAILLTAPVGAEEPAPVDETRLRLAAAQLVYHISTGKGQLQLVPAPDSKVDLEEFDLKEQLALSRFSVVGQRVLQGAGGISVLDAKVESSDPDAAQDLQQLLGQLSGSTALAERLQEGGLLRIKVSHEKFVSFPPQLSSGKVESNPEGGTTTLTFEIDKDVVKLVIAMQAALGLIDGESEQKYQHDADIFRMRHLLHYGELIQEFKKKTGRYPLEGVSELDTFVYFATPEQESQLLGGPDYSHSTLPQEAFRQELEKALDRKIELRFDPQRVMVEAPVYYIYLVRDGEYYFAIHLNIERSFTRAVGKAYHKMEITTSASERKGVWTFEKLLADEGWKAAHAEKPLSEEFFLKLQELHK